MWQVTYKNNNKPYKSRSLQKCIDTAFVKVNTMSGMGGHDGVFISKEKDGYSVDLYNVGYGHKSEATIKQIKQ